MDADGNSGEERRRHREQARLRGHRVDEIESAAAEQADEGEQCRQVAPRRQTALDANRHKRAVDAELVEQPGIACVHRDCDVVVRLHGAQVRREEHAYRSLAGRDHAYPALHAALLGASMRWMPSAIGTPMRYPSSFSSRAMG